MSWKSRYTPQNPDKYKGDVNNIICRSSWERDVAYHMDHNPNVIEWCMEELAIPYIDPLTGKCRRYFPDFWAKMRDKHGNTITTIIEVKPKKETVEPKKPSRPSRKYANAMAKYLVNEAKWNAAKEFCDGSDIIFRVMTEYDIYGPSGKKYTTKKKKKS